MLGELVFLFFNCSESKFEAIIVNACAFLLQKFVLDRFLLEYSFARLSGLIFQKKLDTPPTRFYLRALR